MFVNLTAAYDTVWHRGLTCKVLRLVSDRHNMELIRNHNFTLTTATGPIKRLRHLRTGVL